MSQSKIMKMIMLVVIACVLLVTLVVWKKPHWVSHDHSDPSVLPKAVSINTAGQPTMGSAKAPLKIVSFEDFKCTNCRFFDLQLLPWLVEEYIKPGKANYTAITVSFLPDSMQAAIAARCVYQQHPQQFFVFSDLLFHKQGDEMRNWANTAKLMEWSSEIPNLDHDAFSACLLSADMSNQIIDNTQYAMDVMGGKLSTPAVYINGVLVRPLSKQHIKEVIQSLKHQEVL